MCACRFESYPDYDMDWGVSWSNSLNIDTSINNDTISNGRCVDSLEKGVRTGSKRCAKMIELHIQHK